MSPNPEGTETNNWNAYLRKKEKNPLSFPDSLPFPCQVCKATHMIISFVTSYVPKPWRASWCCRRLGPRDNWPGVAEWWENNVHCIQRDTISCFFWNASWIVDYNPLFRYDHSGTIDLFHAGRWLFPPVWSTHYSKAQDTPGSLQTISTGPKKACAKKVNGYAHKLNLSFQKWACLYGSAFKGLFEVWQHVVSASIMHPPSF